jgi:hypothetical protein
MAGSWELINQNRVLTVTLTREIVSTAWAMGFRNLQIPGTYTFLSGMPFDHARNTGCQKLLELGWEWLFFLDDDIICPPDTIYRLMAHKLPIVSGLYYRRAEPIVPCMLRENEKKDAVNWVTNFTAGELLEVDLVGSGCMLIHRSVLTDIPVINNNCKWFEWRCDREDLPQLDRTSEDFTFCKHVKKHGIKLYVDTSIQCRHIGLGESNIRSVYKPLELKA